MSAPYPTLTPDHITAISQRNLYRWWDRRRLESALPPINALAEESVTPLLSECIYYQVMRTGPASDFLATSHGSDVHPLFGQRVAGTLLSAHAAPALVEGVLRSYRVCVEAKRPVYTVRHAQDDHHVPVEIEILRLPLSEDGSKVEAILSHFSTVSGAGAFDRRQLVRTGSSEDYAVAAIISGRP